MRGVGTSGVFGSVNELAVFDDPEMQVNFWSMPAELQLLCARHLEAADLAAAALDSVGFPFSDVATGDTADIVVVSGTIGFSGCVWSGYDTTTEAVLIMSIAAVLDGVAEVSVRHSA